MENEYPESHVVLEKTEKWYTPLTTVTTISKVLAAIVFISMPFIGFWYGALYFSDSEHEPTYSNESTHSQPIKNEPTISSFGSTTSAQGDSEDCFAVIAQKYPESVITAFAPPIDTSGWTTFDGYGFSIKYPADKIHIEEHQSDADYPFGYTITFVNGDQEIPFGEIVIHNLASKLEYSTMVEYDHLYYELFSNLWWLGPDVSNDVSFSQFKKCSPRAIGYTDFGRNPVYSSIDPEDTIPYYLTVIRDFPRDQYSQFSYEPVIFEFFRFTYDDVQQSLSDTEFKSILENMIKTLVYPPRNN